MNKEIIYHNLSSAKQYSEEDKAKVILLTSSFWKIATEISPSSNALITALLNIAAQTFFLYGLSGATKETVYHDIEMFKRDIIEGLEFLNQMEGEGQ